MGMDSVASLGYGFAIPKEFTSGKAWMKLEDAVAARKDLDLVIHGENEPIITVCIKSSVQETWACDDLKIIKNNLLIAKDEWKDILSSFAKEEGIDKPKIGWYLLSRYM